MHDQMAGNDSHHRLYLIITLNITHYKLETRSHYIFIFVEHHNAPDGYDSPRKIPRTDIYISPRLVSIFLCRPCLDIGEGNSIIGMGLWANALSICILGIGPGMDYTMALGVYTVAFSYIFILVIA